MDKEKESSSLPDLPEPAGDGEVALNAETPTGEDGAEKVVVVVDPNQPEPVGAGNEEPGKENNNDDKQKAPEKLPDLLPPPLAPAPTIASISTGSAEPKIIKKGDKVITSYVDEKTGKIAAYQPGIKLEVSDYAGKWYPAKVVEVDTGENEILVHFENWSTRFDEWIKMDSNRLRPTQNTNVVKTTFKVGEKVEAIWGTDGHRYPGEILNVLPNDYYTVLFDDGIRYKKKYNQIFKLKKTRASGHSLPDNGPPATPPATNPKLARPLPKLIPAPFLMGSDDKYAQQPMNALPPNVPLCTGTTSNADKGRRISSAKNEIGQQSAVLTPGLHKPQFSVFDQVPTDLGKRRRTVKDYSELLKTPSLRPSNDGTGSGTKVIRRRRGVSEKSVSELGGHPENTKPERCMARKSVSLELCNELGGEVIEHKPGASIRGTKSIGKGSVSVALNRPGLIESTEDKASTENESLKGQTDTTIQQNPVSNSEASGEAPLTKRRRTIHDYSMMLKTRLPRMSSFSSASECESPAVIRRRRRKQTTPSESDVSQVESVDVQPSYFDKAETIDSRHESVNAAPTTKEPVQDSTPQSPGKAHLVETQLHGTENTSKRTIKKPPGLVEFDMFAPKTKKGLPTRRVNGEASSPQKTKAEGIAADTLKSETVKKTCLMSERSKSLSTSMDKDDSDDELLDIPDYALRSDDGKEKEELIENPEPLNHQLSKLRRAGRPFRRNKPSGQWNYNYTGYANNNSTFTVPDNDDREADLASTTQGVPYVQKLKAGPKVHDTRQPVPKLMKNLRIPVVPIQHQSTEKQPDDILRGLSTSKLDRLQRKLLDEGINHSLDTEPAVKDVSVDVINCSCGSVDEHGLMIQCELCQCWQHGHCFGYNENSEMPSYYVCDSCKFPFHARESMKNEWNQEFKKKGTLPKIVLNAPPNPELERMILESSEIQDRLYHVLDVIHSNRTKLQIANKLPEHPKIYQWDKPAPKTEEEIRARLYEKLYKPILKRLLYVNRDDPSYPEKLRQKVINRMNNDDNQANAAEPNSEVLNSAPLNEHTENTLLEESTETEKDKTEKDTPPGCTVSEVTDLVKDLVSQVEVSVGKSKGPRVPRPDSLNIKGQEGVDTSEETSAQPVPNSGEKKGQTPLVDDINLLGNIEELSAVSSKVDPATDDLMLSIFNDPDFEKSFDAPLNAGSVSTATATTMQAPPPAIQSTGPDNKPAVVPTLTRITPELCRENLMNHISDQDDIVDQCLEAAENKILAMEAARNVGFNPSPQDFLKLFNLRKSLTNMLGVVDLVHGLSESPLTDAFSPQASEIENDPSYAAAATDFAAEGF